MSKLKAKPGDLILVDRENKYSALSLHEVVKINDRYVVLYQIYPHTAYHEGIFTTSINCFRLSIYYLIPKKERKKYMEMFMMLALAT